jgi:hypothetical protein
MIATQIPSNKTVTLNGSAAIVKTSPIYGVRYLNCIAANDDASISVVNYDIFDPRNGAISMWVNIQTDPGTGYYYFLGYGDGTNNRFLVGIDATNLYWRFVYTADGSSFSADGSTAFTLGKWHNILLQFSDSNNYGFTTIWVNGQFVNNHAPTKAFNYGTGTLYIGSNDAGTPGVDCLIDELLITKNPYSKQIWTAFGKPLWCPLKGT